jgi:hypothetical protein
MATHPLNTDQPTLCRSSRNQNYPGKHPAFFCVITDCYEFSVPLWIKCGELDHAAIRRSRGA